MTERDSGGRPVEFSKDALDRERSMDGRGVETGLSESHPSWGFVEHSVEQCCE